jgi:hypothetical protein
LDFAARPFQGEEVRVLRGHKSILRLLTARRVVSIILCEIPFSQFFEEWQVLGDISYGL